MRRAAPPLTRLARVTLTCVTVTGAVLTSAGLAGCGGSHASSHAAGQVQVTGRLGQAPKVSIPSAKAAGSLVVKTLIHGTGPALPATGTLLGNYVVYLWNGSSHRLLSSSFGTATSPEDKPLIMAGLVPGLQKALTGRRAGSRVMAVIPPSLGFGKSGNPQAGVTGTDTLVWVVDVLGAFPAGATASGRQVSTGGGSLPTVKTPAGQPPVISVPSAKTPSASLVSTTLIKGTGPVVRSGDTVAVQYVGAVWRDGKVFQSSFVPSGGHPAQPFSFVIDASPSQVIPAWNTGLTGQTVGSRVLLVIPPKDGYGAAGQPPAIKGTDTLVFAVDILATAPATKMG